MKTFILFVFAFSSFSCDDKRTSVTSTSAKPSFNITSTIFEENSWQYFLQHLPETKGPILDYKGNIVSNQEKHFAIINYDVGTHDLQQCADAVMRLRAEYLFAQKRYDAIGFHFVSGEYYSWKMYRDGIKPIAKGNNVQFVNGIKHDESHTSLRNYLDIVYAYASTISLCKELKLTNDFAVGTVIIWAESPGHTCIIIDEAKDENGNKIYKLAEGYMPAQSIYVLSNPYEPEINPWYHLNKDEVLTASCDFKSFYLKKFE